MDATLSIAFSFSVDAAVGTNLTGLCYYDTYIWVAVRSTNKIAKYTLEGVLVTSWTTPGSTPSGLATAGDYKLISDDTTGKIYYMNEGGGLQDTWDAPGEYISGLEEIEDLPIKLSCELKYDFAIFNKSIYFCCGDDLIFRYSYGVCHPVNNSPIYAKYLKVFENHLIAGGFSNNSNRSSSDIQWSDLLDGESWDLLNYIGFDPDDGDEIRGFEVYQNNLIVFKLNNKWRLSPTGDWDLPFYKTYIDNIGTINHHSLIIVNGILYFVANDGIRQFNGTSSSTITSKLLNSVNSFLNGYWNNWNNVDVIYIKELNQIKWTIVIERYDSKDVSMLTYDLLTDSFFTSIGMDIGNVSVPENFVTIDKWGKNEERFYLASSYKYLIKFENGYAYIDHAGNVSGILARFTTKPFDFGIPHKDKQLKRIYVFVKNEASAYNLNFYISVDGKSFEALSDISLYEANGGTRLTRMIDLGERVGKNFQFKFENNNADQPFTIYEYIIEYQVLPRI